MLYSPLSVLLMNHKGVATFVTRLTVTNTIQFMSTIKLLTYPAYDILSIFHKTYLALTHDADDLK